MVEEHEQDGVYGVDGQAIDTQPVAAGVVCERKNCMRGETEPPTRVCGCI